MVKSQFSLINTSDVETGEQVRLLFADEPINGLKDNINEQGLLQPIRVQKLPSGKYRLIDGERRLRAHERAGLKSIQAIIVDAEMLPHEFLMQQLAANVHSVALTPIEKAKAFVNLMKLAGWTQAETAAKLGMSGPTVSRLVTMTSLPEEIQEKVHLGKISFSAACELSQITDPTEQAQAAGRIERGEVNRDGLAAARKRTKAQPQITTSKLVRSVAVLEDGRSITVSTPGNTLDAFIEALEECLKKARNAKQSSASLSTFLKLQRDKAHAAV